MPKPAKENSAKEDRLLDELRSIHTAAGEHPGELGAALKSNDPNVQAAAYKRLHELSEGLTELIITDSRFFGNDVRMVASIGGGKSGFYPAFVGWQLALRLVELGSPEAAIKWLVKVLSTSHADGQMITLIRGAPVSNAIDLTPKIKLVPLTDVQDGPQKRMMTSFQVGQRPAITGAFEWQPPSSALVISYPQHPFLVGEESLDTAQYLADVEHVADAILALTLVGPRIVIHAWNWFSFDDPDLEAARLGISWGSPNLEVIPNQGLEGLPVLNVAEARQAIEGFMSLKGRSKDKVRIALSRLKLALSRHSVGDKALEVAIAFEALLEDGGNSEMTHKVKVRTARLIGGTRAERERNAAIVGRTYAVRSALVHKGHIKSSKTYELSSDETNVSAESLMVLATDVCAKLIWAILRIQKIPEWTSFDVTEDAVRE